MAAQSGLPDHPPFGRSTPRRADQRHYDRLLLLVALAEASARKPPGVFERFNYVLSAALDAGASVNALTIFVLTLSLLKYAPVPHWAANPLQDAEHCRPSA